MVTHRTWVTCSAAIALTSALVATSLAQPASAPKDTAERAGQPAGQPPAAQPPAAQSGEPPRDRPSRRAPMTRDELREHLKQLQDRLTEAQKLVNSAEVTDEQLSQKLDEMHPMLRRFFAGSGEGWGGGRGGGGGGGGGPDGRGEMGDDKDRGDRGGDGRWAPWGPRGGEPDSGKPVTQEEVDAAMAWVGKNMPRLAPRLTELNQKDPEAVKRIVQRMRGRIAEIERLAKDEPLTAKVRIEEWQAGMRVVDTSRTLRDRVRNKAPQAEIDTAREDVRAALVLQFDAQIEMQKNDLAQMKTKIEDLQKRLDARQSGRDKWLEDRLKDIESGKDHRGPSSSGERGEKGDRPEKDRK